MRTIFHFIVCISLIVIGGGVYAQQNLQIQLLSTQDSLPVAGATVSSTVIKARQSNALGMVVIDERQVGQELRIRHVGFENISYKITSAKLQKVYLVPLEGSIDEVEVVGTGYFQAPKERLSGSFTHIDNKLLNRSSSTNLLDRLEGITNGLQFDRGELTGENINGDPMLRVRGASTLESNGSPLIIVDDFPFDGDIQSINPNEVESVTILKDASAASIWGARAGNGVIVINMKKGAYQQKTAISFQSTYRVTSKPDLFHSKEFVNPETVMGFQEEIFDMGVYREINSTYMPVYVELLIKQRDGLITDEEFEETKALYMKSDIRRDAMKYLYRPAVQQQYNVGIRGGEQSYRYQISGGFDRQSDHIIGQQSSRKNLSLQSGFKLMEGLELEGTLRYTGNQARTNPINQRIIGTGNVYLPLVDEEGNSLAIPVFGGGLRYGYQEQAEANGFLDWMYRPVDELHNTRFDSNSDTRTLGVSLRYQLPMGLRLQSHYYHTTVERKQESFYAEDSYYARDLVNKYTQADGTKVIPEGAVYRTDAPRGSRLNSLRFQADYTKEWREDWRLDALAGLEGSDQESYSGTSYTFYGYDTRTEKGTPFTNFGRQTYVTLPDGRITTVVSEDPPPTRGRQRNLSMYTNWGLSWKQQYVFNGSLRWDGSNLLGVKTNARGVALWSAGLAWNIHKADFYKLESFDLLKLRLTYGSAGNIDKSQSHSPVVRYSGISQSTGLPYSELLSPGNPSLRWEQVNTLNMGLDWSFKGLLSGSVEYYIKDAKHLLSAMAIDPTIGVKDNYKQNYANMRNQGVDFSLNGNFQIGNIRVDNHLLLNYTRNKVTHVDGPELSSITEYITSKYFKTGESRDRLYSYPWYGLRSDNGLPVMRLVDGEEPGSYKEYRERFEVDELIRSGLRVAPFYGSYRLGLSYQGIQASALFIGKFGHVTRRTSYTPGKEFEASLYPDYHMDYYYRWQKPGDELHTDVPASVFLFDASLAAVYQHSHALITPLDYIALRDINLSYTFQGDWISRSGIKGLTLTSSIQNVGLVWVKNKNDVHPEYPNTVYPAGRQYYLGLRFNF